MAASRRCEPVLLAVLPEGGSALGLRSVLRNFSALVEAAFAPRYVPRQGLRSGEERIVLVIPAFLAGDWATWPLRNFLAQLGYRPVTAGIRLNLGPTPGLVARLDGAVLRFAAQRDAPIDIIGQSLGGVLARDVPPPSRPNAPGHDLCSPIRAPITTPLAPLAHFLANFTIPAGSPGADCRSPLGVPVTALYSEDDGIVDWHECLQDETALCRNVTRRGTHATIGSSPAALAAIAKRSFLTATPPGRATPGRRPVQRAVGDTLQPVGDFDHVGRLVGRTFVQAKFTRVRTKSSRNTGKARSAMARSLASGMSRPMATISRPLGRPESRIVAYIGSMII